MLKLKITNRENCKINHLSFIGDPTLKTMLSLSEHNYVIIMEMNLKIIIRKNSYRTGTKLIAPIEVGENATIGSGSVITKNVAANKLTLSRVKQVVVDNCKTKIIILYSNKFINNIKKGSIFCKLYNSDETNMKPAVFLDRDGVMLLIKVISIKFRNLNGLKVPKMRLNTLKIKAIYICSN